MMAIELFEWIIPRRKKPNLFWRRLAAVMTDLVLLCVLVWIGTATMGFTVSGVFLAWFAFFILWYRLALKYNTTPGQALLGIVTNFEDTRGEKSPRLLLRFVVTWVPLFFLSLPVFELGRSEQSALATFLQRMIPLWYLALLVGLVITQGKAGIQDAICKSELVLHIRETLSAGRKVVAWICAMILIVIGSTMFSHEEPEGEANPTIATPEGGGLPFESLELAAHTVYGYWKELDLVHC